MTKRSLACVAIFFSFGAVQAQEEAGGYVYTTYHICNTADLGVADEIAKFVMAPAYDKAVEAGAITSWGWLAHHTGGTWRRATYFGAATIEGLLDAQESIGAAIDENNPEGNRVFAKACPSHEDYIWQTVPGSGGNNIAGDRGAAGFSVYYKCDPGKEERADELVANHFGPIYQKQVDAGNLASWGWLQHNVGGEWRRLLTATAATHKGMLKTRGSMIDEITSGRNKRLSKEFDTICPSHQDYMWDIQIETP